MNFKHNTTKTFESLKQAHTFVSCLSTEMLSQGFTPGEDYIAQISKEGEWVFVKFLFNEPGVYDEISWHLSNFMKSEQDQSILQEAHNIVNERDEEKDRMYGPFSEGMDRAAKIFSGMTGLDITGREMYMALIALKFSRGSYHHKRDNLLDAVGYIQGLENYLNNK